MATITAEDRLAIAELLARYNHAIDHFEAEAWAALFTQDGELVANGQVRAGGRLPAGGRFSGDHGHVPTPEKPVAAVANDLVVVLAHDVAAAVFSIPNGILIL
jgi:hypothetical protein